MFNLNTNEVKNVKCDLSWVEGELKQLKQYLHV